MKFKVYEVTVIHFDRTNDTRQDFFYADYPDAVKKFKELIDEAKQIDWIKNGLASGDDKYKLKRRIDYWHFYLDDALNYMEYEVSIEEREVL